MRHLGYYLRRYFFRGTLLIVMVSLSNPAQALNWKTEIVDASGNTGWFSSLAMNGQGLPRIAYQFWDPGTSAVTLKYALWNGNAWVFEDIDSSARPSSISLYLSPGVASNPQVTYYDGKTSSLKYAYESTLPPFGWVVETVDNTAAGVGWGSSLKVDQNGTPKVSYCDIHDVGGVGTNKLKYAVRNGNSWELSAYIDNAGSLNLGIGETSLALDAAGHPHIVYWSNGKLKRAYNLGLPSVGWFTEIVDSSQADVGRGNSITMDKDGWFHVSYIDFTNKKLKYAHHNTVNWVIFAPIDDAQDSQTSMALDDHGGVHICYRTSGAPTHNDGDLKYAYNSGKGFSTWVTQTVDGGDPFVGEFCSLKLDPQGKPRISYFDRTNGDLKYTQALYEIYQPVVLK